MDMVNDCGGIIYITTLSILLLLTCHMNWLRESITVLFSLEENMDLEDSKIILPLIIEEISGSKKTNHILL